MIRTKWVLALYAMAGAVAPDILLFYSKRWTMPQVKFSIPQYVFATILYLAVAGIVSTIFPYKAVFKNTLNLPWKAFSVGFSLPVVLSTVAALSRTQLIVPRGGSIPGNLHDLLALF